MIDKARHIATQPSSTEGDHLNITWELRCVDKDLLRITLFSSKRKDCFLYFTRIRMLLLLFDGAACSSP